MLNGAIKSLDPRNTMTASPEQTLAVEKHVEYIQDLDNVRRQPLPCSAA